MIDKFINSWYFVTLLMGLLFIYLTRQSWNKLIDQATLKIKTRFLSINRNKDKQSLVGKLDKLEQTEYQKIKKLFQDLKVDDFDQFNELLKNFAKGSEDNLKRAESSESQVKTIFNLWKFYMFAFLNLFLVPRSKLALIWISNNPNVTKDMFLLNIIISPEMQNKELEKEAVFNALLAHNLIEKDSRDLYVITNIGLDFLRFTGLTK